MSFIPRGLSASDREHFPPWTCAAKVRLAQMKKEQLAKRLAKESHIATAVAADQVDRIVSDLLVRVRRGEAASLPGLGTFQSGSKEEFQFDRDVTPRPQPARPKKGTR
jgi:hypothetical protein